MNLKEYRDKHTDYYEKDAPLDEVASDIFYRSGLQDKYGEGGAAVRQWAKDAGHLSEMKQDAEARRKQLRQNYKERRIQYEGQRNQEEMSAPARGLAGGIQKWQGLLHGAAGLAGDAIGWDALQDWGMEGYERNMLEAQKYPTDVEFGDLLPGGEEADIGDFGEWIGYTLGDLLPSMVTGLVSGGTGALAGGLATTGLRAAGKKIGTDLVERGFKNAVKKQMAKGVPANVAKKATERGLGAQLGVAAGMAPLEGGGMYGEAVEAVGKEEANPYSAGILGLAAGAVELVGGNMRIINKVLGKQAGEAAGAAIKLAKKDAKARPAAMQVLGGILHEAARQAPGEMGQEAAQEALAIANMEWTAPDVQRALSLESAGRMLEAAAAGGLAGIAGSPAASVAEHSPLRDNKQEIDQIEADLQNKIKRQENLITKDGREIAPGVKDKLKQNRAELEKVQQTKGEKQGRVSYKEAAATLDRKAPQPDGKKTKVSTVRKMIKSGKLDGNEYGVTSQSLEDRIKKVGGKQEEAKPAEKDSKKPTQDQAGIVEEDSEAESKGRTIHADDEIGSAAEFEQAAKAAEANREQPKSEEQVQAKQERPTPQVDVTAIETSEQADAEMERIKNEGQQLQPEEEERRAQLQSDWLAVKARKNELRPAQTAGPKQAEGQEAQAEEDAASLPSALQSDATSNEFDVFQQEGAQYGTAATEEVSGDQGRVSGRGVLGEGSTGERGQDLQQPAQEKPEAGNVSLLEEVGPGATSSEFDSFSAERTEPTVVPEERRTQIAQSVERVESEMGQEAIAEAENSIEQEPVQAQREEVLGDEYDEAEGAAVDAEIDAEMEAELREQEQGKGAEPDEVSKRVGNDVAMQLMDEMYGTRTRPEMPADEKAKLDEESSEEASLGKAASELGKGISAMVRGISKTNQSGHIGTPTQATQEAIDNIRRERSQEFGRAKAHFREAWQNVKDVISLERFVEKLRNGIQTRLNVRSRALGEMEGVEGRLRSQYEKDELESLRVARRALTQFEYEMEQYYSRDIPTRDLAAEALEEEDSGFNDVLTNTIKQGQQDYRQRKKDDSELSTETQNLALSAIKMKGRREAEESIILTTLKNNAGSRIKVLQRAAGKLDPEWGPNVSKKEKQLFNETFLDDFIEKKDRQMLEDAEVDNNEAFFEYLEELRQQGDDVPREVVAGASRRVRAELVEHMRTRLRVAKVLREERGRHSKIMEDTVKVAEAIESRADEVITKQIPDQRTLASQEYKEGLRKKYKDAQLRLAELKQDASQGQAEQISEPPSSMMLSEPIPPAHRAEARELEQYMHDLAQYAKSLPKPLRRMTEEEAAQLKLKKMGTEPVFKDSQGNLVNSSSMAMQRRMSDMGLDFVRDERGRVKKDGGVVQFRRAQQPGREAVIADLKNLHEEGYWGLSEFPYIVGFPEAFGGVAYTYIDNKAREGKAPYSPGGIIPKTEQDRRQAQARSGDSDVKINKDTWDSIRQGYRAVDELDRLRRNRGLNMAGVPDAKRKVLAAYLQDVARSQVQTFNKSEDEMRVERFVRSRMEADAKEVVITRKQAAELKQRMDAARIRKEELLNGFGPDGESLDYLIEQDMEAFNPSLENKNAKGKEQERRKTQAEFDFNRGKSVTPAITQLRETLRKIFKFHNIKNADLDPKQMTIGEVPGLFTGNTVTSSKQGLEYDPVDVPRFSFVDSAAEDNGFSGDLWTMVPEDQGGERWFEVPNEKSGQTRELVSLPHRKVRNIRNVAETMWLSPADLQKRKVWVHPNIAHYVPEARQEVPGTGRYKEKGELLQFRKTLQMLHENEIQQQLADEFGDAGSARYVESSNNQGNKLLYVYPKGSQSIPSIYRVATPAEEVQIGRERAEAAKVRRESERIREKLREQFGDEWTEKDFNDELAKGRVEQGLNKATEEEAEFLKSVLGDVNSFASDMTDVREARTMAEERGSDIKSKNDEDLSDTSPGGTGSVSDYDIGRQAMDNMLVERGKFMPASGATEDAFELTANRLASQKIANTGQNVLTRWTEDLGREFNVVSDRSEVAGETVMGMQEFSKALDAVTEANEGDWADTRADEFHGSVAQNTSGLQWLKAVNRAVQSLNKDLRQRGFSQHWVSLTGVQNAKTYQERRAAHKEEVHKALRSNVLLSEEKNDAASEPTFAAKERKVVRYLMKAADGEGKTAQRAQFLLRKISDSRKVQQSHSDAERLISDLSRQGLLTDKQEAAIKRQDSSEKKSWLTHRMIMEKALGHDTEAKKKIDKIERLRSEGSHEVADDLFYSALQSKFGLKQGFHNYETVNIDEMSVEQAILDTIVDTKIDSETLQVLTDTAKNRKREIEKRKEQNGFLSVRDQQRLGALDGMISATQGTHEGLTFGDLFWTESLRFPNKNQRETQEGMSDVAVHEAIDIITEPNSMIEPRQDGTPVTIADELGFQWIVAKKGTDRDSFVSASDAFNSVNKEDTIVGFTRALKQKSPTGQADIVVARDTYRFDKMDEVPIEEQLSETKSYLGDEAMMSEGGRESEVVSAKRTAQGLQVVLRGPNGEQNQVSYGKSDLVNELKRMERSMITGYQKTGDPNSGLRVADSPILGAIHYPMARMKTEKTANEPIRQRKKLQFRDSPEYLEGNELTETPDIAGLDNEVSLLLNELPAGNEVAVTFVSNLNSKQIPSRLRKRVQQESTTADPAKQVLGLYDNGNVYVFLNNHANADGTLSTEEVFKTILHETAGHHGMKSVIHNEYKGQYIDFLHEVNNAYGKEINSPHKAGSIKWQNDLEEFLATRLENAKWNPEKQAYQNTEIAGWFDKLADFVIKSIRKVGETLGLKKEIPLTRPEIRVLLSKAYGGLKTEGHSGIPHYIPNNFKPAHNVPALRDFHTFEENMMDTILRKMEDMFRPWRLFNKAIRKEGIAVTDDMNVEQKLRVHPGKPSPRMERIKENFIYKFADEINKRNLAHEDVSKFLFAHTVLERNPRLREAYNNQDINAGMTDEAANAILATFDSAGKTKDLETVSQIVWDANDLFLDNSVQYGFITQEEADKMRKAYKRFVPMAPDEELTNTNKPPSGMKGRVYTLQEARAQTELGKDPVEWTFQRLQNQIVNGEKNIVKQTLLNLGERVGGASNYSNGRSMFTMYYPQAKLDRIREEKGWDQVQLENWMVRKNIHSIDQALVSTTFEEANPEAIPVQRDGETYYIEIGNERLRRSFLQQDVPSSNAIVRGIAKLSRWLVLMNTSFNPEFVYSNLFRDAGTAMGNVYNMQNKNMTPEQATKQVAKEIPRALKGIFAYKFGRGGANEYTDLFVEYEDAGGRIGLPFIGNTQEVLMKSVQMQAKGSQNPLAKVTRDSGKKFVETVTDINDVVENASRLVAFKMAKEAGQSNERAAKIARELTVDFNRKGEWGQLFNSLYLFANAGIGGSARILRGMARNPRRASKQVGTIVAGGMSLALLNGLVSGEDDDGVKYYDKIDEGVKQSNMIIMIPGTDGEYMKIPMPYGFGFFYNLGQSVSDFAMGDEMNRRSPLDTAGNIMGSLAHNFNPLSPTGGLNTAQGWLQFVSPTLGDPAVDLFMEKTPFGSPLMPTPEYAGQPDSARHWDSVSPMSSAISKWINDMTGGESIDDTPVESGAVDISPETFDYMLNFVGGGAQRFYMDKMIGWGMSKVRGEDTNWNDVPGMRRMIGEPYDFYNRQLFNETTAAVEGVNDRYKEIEKMAAYARDPENKREARQMAREYRQENKELMNLDQLRKNQYARLKDIETQKERVHKSGWPEKKKERVLRELDRKGYNVMKQFNKRYLEVVR